MRSTWVIASAGDTIGQSENAGTLSSNLEISRAKSSWSNPASENWLTAHGNRAEPRYSRPGAPIHPEQPRGTKATTTRLTIAGNRKFESTALHRRVQCEPSVRFGSGVPNAGSRSVVLHPGRVRCQPCPDLRHVQRPAPLNAQPSRNLKPRSGVGPIFRRGETHRIARIFRGVLWRAPRLNGCQLAPTAYVRSQILRLLQCGQRPVCAHRCRSEPGTGKPPLQPKR